MGYQWRWLKEIIGQSICRHIRFSITLKFCFHQNIKIQRRESSPSLLVQNKQAFSGTWKRSPARWQMVRHNIHTGHGNLGIYESFPVYKNWRKLVVAARKLSRQTLSYNCRRTPTSQCLLQYLFFILDGGKKNKCPFNNVFGLLFDQVPSTETCAAN